MEESKELKVDKCFMSFIQLTVKLFEKRKAENILNESLTGIADEEIIQIVKEFFESEMQKKEDEEMSLKESFETESDDSLVSEGMITETDESDEPLQ